MSASHLRPYGAISSGAISSGAISSGAIPLSVLLKRASLFTDSTDITHPDDSTSIADPTDLTTNNVAARIPPVPSMYRVSTITAIGSVSTPVNIDMFFDSIFLIDGNVPGHDSGYVYVEMAGRCRGTRASGSRSNKSSADRAERRMRSLRESGLTECASMLESGSGGGGKQRHHFDNQATVVLKLDDANRINIKVFKNGKVQLTGIKQRDKGMQAIHMLVDELRRLGASKPELVGKLDDLRAADYKVCLINSDFHLGFPLRREKLYAVLRAKQGAGCIYEPCAYPGVKIQFMWNSAPNTLPAGACRCRNWCDGKGGGHGDGDCRKVTIAVFQSGCVIITGAHTLQQIDDAYKFITEVCATHFHEIRRQ